MLRRVVALPFCNDWGWRRLALTNWYFAFASAVGRAEGCRNDNSNKQDFVHSAHHRLSAKSDLLILIFP